jgi:hypothetical protein
MRGFERMSGARPCAQLLETLGNPPSLIDGRSARRALGAAGGAGGERARDGGLARTVGLGLSL